jgi:hypothetical protein
MGVLTAAYRENGAPSLPEKARRDEQGGDGDVRREEGPAAWLGRGGVAGGMVATHFRVSD